MKNRTALYRIFSISLLTAASSQAATTTLTQSSAGALNGNVNYMGSTIATWSLTQNSLTGFSGATVSVTTTSTTAIGVDVQSFNTDADGWDYTLTVTPTVGAPANVNGITLLGWNPDRGRDLGPQEGSSSDVLTFNGSGLGAGTLSDPLEGTLTAVNGGTPGDPSDHSNGNLTQPDGGTIPLGGTANWEIGDKPGAPPSGTNWDQNGQYSQWSIAFPTTSTTGATSPISFQYEADFGENVAADGFAFEVCAITVPEPSSTLLCALSGMALMIRRRRS